MTTKPFVGAFILALAPTVAAAQSVVRLDSDDVYFTSQLARKPLPSRAPEAMISAPTRYCGFQIPRQSSQPEPIRELNGI